MRISILCLSFALGALLAHIADGMYSTRFPAYPTASQAHFMPAPAPWYACEVTSIKHGIAKISIMGPIR